MPIGNAFDTSTLGTGAINNPESINSNIYKQIHQSVQHGGGAGQAFSPGFSATGAYYLSGVAPIATYSSILVSALPNETITIYEVNANSFAAPTVPCILGLFTCSAGGTNPDTTYFMLVQSSTSGPFRMAIPNGYQLPRGRSLAVMRIAAGSVGITGSYNPLEIVYAETVS